MKPLLFITYLMLTVSVGCSNKTDRPVEHGVKRDTVYFYGSPGSGDYTSQNYIIDYNGDTLSLTTEIHKDN